MYAAISVVSRAACVLLALRVTAPAAKLLADEREMAAAEALVSQKAKVRWGGAHVVAAMCPARFDDEMLAPVRDLPFLRELHIGGRKVTDAGLEPVAAMGELQVLSVSSGRITNAAMVHIAGLTKLRGLGIAGTQVTDEGIARLAALKTLEKLSLHGPIVYDGPPPPIMFTDKSLEVIGTLRDLRELNVGVGSRFTGDGLRHLSGLTELRSLTMQTVPFTDEAARACEGMLDLERLLFDEMHATLSDEGLKSLSKLHRLKWLRLTPTKVTDDGLRLLAPMVGLEELGIVGPQFTDAGLAVLEFLPNLHTLGVSRSQTTDKGMRVFKWLPRLRILCLDHTAISDAGTVHLVGLKHLTRLVLNDTKITDETLARVSRLPELLELQIDNTALTDKGLRYLEDSKLQVLSVKGTRVTDAALERLLEKLPNLQIER